MREKPVKNKELSEDYDLYWQNQVSGVVETLYKDSMDFVNAYNENSDKMVKKVSSKMKVVPYDLRYHLHRFYVSIIKEDWTVV